MSKSVKSGKRKRGKPAVLNKEEVAEDWCFECKDGGDLLICDFKQCMKAYHPGCVEKAENILGTGKRWICPWHSCLICNKRSRYHCFVCKHAVCKKCIKYVMFVLVRGNHGFCNNCLSLALLIEDNVDVDSDGRKIDFKDRNTCEGLFKEYWEIIKEKEGLSSEDVRSADILLKKGECFSDEVDTDKFVNADEEDQDFDESMEVDTEPRSLMARETKWLPPSKHARKVKQKSRQFMGWGSKSLIEFLKSIGKNSISPIDQNEVRDIILEYIREKKLSHPEKRRNVLCDIKLQSIFGRKSINRNKIYDLLERHFAENLEQSEEDDYSCNSDEKGEDTIMTCRRQTRASLRRRRDEEENVLEIPRSCFASVIDHNIKLIYLKRTLIEDFMMTPETFDDKVMGSFVRAKSVKSNPNDYFHKNVYQLLQVTGVTKTQGVENSIGETTLRLSNMKEDIQICMLSDDNFLEEEIEELHQRVKNGLLERLSIVELEQKARRLHEDLTEHWIKNELILLQNLIDQANEKGWRKEFCEYFDRKDLLQTPSEKQRLLQEIPKVIPEEIEIEVNPLDLPKDENPIKDNSPRSILLPRDYVCADDITGTEDVIILDTDIDVTRDLCEIQVNGDDTDNRTDETVAEGIEAAISVNAQITPELSVIEVSGDETSKRATESTSGTEDIIILDTDIDVTRDLCEVQVNGDDTDIRIDETVAEGIEAAISVIAQITPGLYVIEVSGDETSKRATESTSGTEDVIILDTDIDVTRDLCEVQVNGDDTDNITDETVAEGIEAAISVNAQITPELSVIEISGDETSKRATESTSGTEDIILDTGIDVTRDICEIQVNGDDTNNRTDETVAEGTVDAISVSAQVTPELSVIEVSGGETSKRATESKSGTEDAIILDTDINITRDICGLQVTGDDTDNRTDETVAGTEAAISANAQVMPELSVIEVSGDETNKRATESTAGIEGALIVDASIEAMPHLSVIGLNGDDSDKRAAEKIVEGVEDAFGVNADSEVMADLSMIEVNGDGSDKQAA